MATKMITFLYYKDGDSRNFPSNLTAEQLGTFSFIRDYFDNQILQQINQAIINISTTNQIKTTDTLDEVIKTSDNKYYDYEIDEYSGAKIYSVAGKIKKALKEELYKDFNIKYLKIICPVGVKVAFPAKETGKVFTYEINKLGYLELIEPVINNFYIMPAKLNKFQNFSNDPLCSITLVYEEIEE